MQYRIVSSADNINREEVLRLLKWDISIRLNNGIKEFAMLTTEIPTGWELLETDYAAEKEKNKKSSYSSRTGNVPS